MNTPIQINVFLLIDYSVALLSSALISYDYSAVHRCVDFAVIGVCSGSGERVAVCSSICQFAARRPAIISGHGMRHWVGIGPCYGSSCPDRYLARIESEVCNGHGGR